MKKIIPILISSFLLISLGQIVSAQTDELPSPGILPDSPFYFLETFAEGIASFFTFGDLKKAGRYATLAAERVAEAKALIEKGKPEFAEKIFERYERQLNQSIVHTERVQAKGKNTKKVAEIVAEGTGKHLTVIESILDKISEKTKTAVTKAKEASMTGQKNALRILAKEDPETAARITLKAVEARLNRAKTKAEEGNIEQVEGAIKDFEDYHELGGEISQIAKDLGKDITFLERLVEETTSIHLEILAEIYEKVPETTKSAIEKAIKVSVKGHEKALESLKTKGVLEKPQKEIIIPEKIPVKVRETIKKEVKKELEEEKLKEEQAEEVPKTIQEEVQKAEQPKKDSLETVACSRDFSPQFGAKSYYAGPLFDAHLHMPISEKFAEVMREAHGQVKSDPILGQDVTLEQILCFFDEEKVNGAIGFYIVDSTSLGDALEVAKVIKEQSADSISLFLMPVVLDTEKLNSIHKSNAGLFQGYGELSFYDDLKPLTPSDQKLFSLYDVAERHNLIVMMHPDMGQKSNIEKALQNNPTVNFLVHGFESEDYITDLMDKYPNVYFSIDSAVLYPMMGLFVSGPKEQFVLRFKQDFNLTLDGKINKWKDKIKKYPNRFMWGTDRGTKWHFDEEISLLFEEFARAFIAGLDPAVQENYAYKNAEKLLKKR